MSHNLRDQLLGLGFQPAPKPERKPAAAPATPRKPGATRSDSPSGAVRPNARTTNSRPTGAPAPNARQNPGSDPAGQRRPHGASNRGAGRGAPPHRAGGAGQARAREDIDLAKAYAIRAQREKDERIAAEQAKQEEARVRREARATLTELVKDKGLNAVDAEIARHFPYGGKIKRIYVTPEQLKQLNAGELGVLQMDGRYLLVTAELVAQAEAIFPPAVALKVDPDAPAADDPYADPQYQVPDDLVW